MEEEDGKDPEAGIHDRVQGAGSQACKGGEVDWLVAKAQYDTNIFTDALTMAGLMHYSDRGSQYASHAFQRELEKYGMICSMSRKGYFWDNAPTESWFNSFKNERVHGLRYETRAEMTATSFEYIEVLYNRKRQHSSLVYKSGL